MINYVEDVELAGEYPVSFAVFLEDYPVASVQSSKSFTIKVENPCLSNAEGRLPSWCPVEEFLPEVLPDWMKQIDDQEITIGGSNLQTYLGDPINAYGDAVTVISRGGVADLFIEHDATFNLFIVR